LAFCGGASVTPGARVRALIEEELGLDQGSFAEKLGVSRQTISGIVNGHQDITREMANRLALMSSRPAIYWLQDPFPDNESSAPTASLFAPGILVDHQMLKAREQGLIEIEPFDPEQIQGSSADLHLSPIVITSKGDPVDISEGGFLLEPGRTINVQTRETIRVARKIAARVGAMTSVSRYGIIAAHGFQVDPGFEGHLEFCLFNAGEKGFRLVSGMPIVSIEFTALSDEPSGRSSARNRDRAEVAHHFGGDIPPAECDALFREALKRHVKISVRKDGVYAEVQDLDIRNRNRSARAAVDDAIHEILTTLRSSLAHSRYRDLRTKYESFFEEIAPEVFLDSARVRTVMRGLKHYVENDIADLGNGKYLSLPQGSAEVSLDVLAGKIGIRVADLVARLTRTTKPPAPIADD
jgi:deoxycytidine triphosphate deaminase/addiction module HigA family antidote